jgi:hypothetical protein
MQSKNRPLARQDQGRRIKFPWMAESKREGAEIAEDFAEKWEIAAGFPTQKLSAFLCELCVSAFR